MELTLENFESVVREMMNAEEPLISLKPTKMYVPPALHELALKILYYKKAIRRCSGMRNRKLNLYWRM